jgi:hypothetical protein
MQLSTERIAKLNTILNEMGLKYSDNELDEAGLAIMRFVLAKVDRENGMKGANDGKGNV